jgi:hypothetical protein
MLAFFIFGCELAAHSQIPEYVDLVGRMKSMNGKFWLETDSHKLYMLAYREADTVKYIGHRVKASGYLVEGYDNPKYGNKNLPIEQIDPKDVINIITGVRLLGADF